MAKSLRKNKTLLKVINIFGELLLPHLKTSINPL